MIGFWRRYLMRWEALRFEPKMPQKRPRCALSALPRADTLVSGKA